MNITALIKDNWVEFKSYKAGFFYYTIDFEGKRYKFPVDREDVGEGEMKRCDKAITFMRWIRKAIDDGTFVELVIVTLDSPL